MSLFKKEIILDVGNISWIDTSKVSL